MKPRIEILQEKTLVGNNIKMSIANNKTGLLWGQFAPRIKEIQNRVSTDKISLQLYPSSYFDRFDPTCEFEKWASVEVDNTNQIPSGMESLVLPGGLYAVFDHKGSDISIFEYIYSEWMPNSIYELDDRPHFEVLGKKYKNNDPNSEEEIWIPVRAQNKA